MFDREKYVNTFSQINASEEMLLEVLNMTKQRNAKTSGRIIRTLAIAAVISAMLATTVFAYMGFTQYENPLEMQKTFFGTEAYSLDEGGTHTVDYFGKTYDVIEPTVEHVVVDEKIVEDVAPYISDVGESLSYGNYTLTMVAHQHDSATDCGIIYYTVENPNGVTGYDVQKNGEVWWPDGEMVRLGNACEKNYIVEDETTPTRLTVACYYCGADEGEYIDVYFYDDENNSLKLYLNDGGGMKNKSYKGDSISISPIAIKLRLTDFESLGKVLEDGTYIPACDDVRLDYLAVRYMDGSIFVVRQDEDGHKIQNYKYALIEDGDYDCAYVFNRLIDIDLVEAVIINEQEYKMS